MREQDQDSRESWFYNSWFYISSSSLGIERSCDKKYPQIFAIRLYSGKKIVRENDYTLSYYTRYGIRNAAYDKFLKSHGFYSIAAWDRSLFVSKSTCIKHKYIILLLNVIKLCYSPVTTPVIIIKTLYIYCILFL